MVFPFVVEFPIVPSAYKKNPADILSQTSPDCTYSSLQAQAKHLLQLLYSEQDAPVGIVTDSTSQAGSIHFVCASLTYCPSGQALQDVALEKEYVLPVQAKQPPPE